MAYNEIPDSWIEVGKALKKSLFTYIRNNFIDHESRINNLETGATSVEIFNFEVMGYINNYTASELVQIGTFKSANVLSISEIKLTLMNGTSGDISSASGVLSVDIEKSEDNGLTWNTILVSQPKIEDGVSASGSQSQEVEFVSGGEVVQENDILRVNVTSKKDTQGSFLITVYANID